MSDDAPLPPAPRRDAGRARVTAWAARLIRGLALLFVLAVAAPAFGHPVPFSYMDLDLHDGRIDGSVTVHVFDAGHDLGVSPPERLLDPALLRARQADMTARLSRGLSVSAGRPLTLEWTGAQVLPERQSLKFSFRIPDQSPGALSVRTDLFPYDPSHQTFVNVYEAGKLRQQWIFGRGAPARTYYFGTAAGAIAVMTVFIPAGVHHILIGPDHLLFLLGLLLLGGSWKALLKIVTAFTVAHSVTLTLATLGLVTPSPAIIEPAIALSIVVVGVDNLMSGGGGRDLRAWAAGLFGLIHGFGFANVLREFGLPREALAWSLFSFNVGVEIGQLIVVVMVATALTLIRRRNPSMGRRLTVGGSVVVIAAGAFWFVQRVFFPGGN